MFLRTHNGVMHIKRVEKKILNYSKHGHYYYYYRDPSLVGSRSARVLTLLTHTARAQRDTKYFITP